MDCENDEQIHREEHTSFCPESNSIKCIMLLLGSPFIPKNYLFELRDKTIHKPFQ